MARMINGDDADQRWAAELEEENRRLKECTVKLKRQHTSKRFYRPEVACSVLLGA
jgi:hypothetical protein